jgi:hypothetical protein
VVDLAAVTFVDRAGKELLAQMCRRGVALVTRGCLMKAIVEEIETETAGAGSVQSQPERGGA